MKRGTTWHLRLRVDRAIVVVHGGRDEKESILLGTSTRGRWHRQTTAETYRFQPSPLGTDWLREINFHVLGDLGIPPEVLERHLTAAEAEARSGDPYRGEDRVIRGAA